METDICCLGELLVDFVADRPDVGDCYRFCPGGAPANVAVGVARLGRKSALIAGLGLDPFSDRLLSIVREEGVDTRGIQRSSVAFTTLAFVEVDSDGERSFFFNRHPGADSLLWFDKIPADLIERSKVLHVGSVSLASEPSRSTTIAAIAKARASGRLVSFDFNYRAPLWQSATAAIAIADEIAQKVDIFKASEEEATLMTGLLDPVAAARELRSRGPRIVIVTLGASGCLCAWRDDVAAVSAIPTTVADTNGAGDSFMAAFLVGLVERLPTMDLDEVTTDLISSICEFAVASSSITVSRPGALPALPIRSEVSAAMERCPRPV